MKVNTLAFLVFQTFSAFSQIDYNEYREYFNLSCGIPDSTVIIQNQQLVDSLKSMKIVAGEQEYLYDHGWTYYLRYLKWKDDDDLKKAASSFERGWKEYNDLTALWNLGTIYRALGNCNRSLDMTELYIKEAPDSIPIDYKQVYFRYKNCRE